MPRMIPALIAPLAAFMMLPACASTTADPPATASGDAGPCSNDGLEAYAGRKVTAELGAELLKKSGAKSLRWGPPNSAMTMDFRPDRLTVSYDEAMMLTSARCG